MEAPYVKHMKPELLWLQDKEEIVSQTFLKNPWDFA